MAKRLLLVSAFAAFVAGGVFAQMPQMSVGAGYIMSRGGLGGSYNDKAGGIDGVTSNQIGKAAQNGGFVFFDATYAELAIGLMHSSFGSKSVETVYGDDGNKTDKTSAKTTYQNTGLAMDISLLGRYPVAVGKMTISPLLGVGYNLVLSEKDSTGKKVEYKDTDKHPNGDAKKTSDLNTFRIQFGAGADFDVTDQIYIRTQGLAHYRFAAKYFSKKANTPDPKPDDFDYKFKGGFGGAFTVAVGYKF